jgi:uncharacterized membrane protein
MNKIKMSGAILATIVGVMFAAQPLIADDNSGSQAQVKCIGGNSCKGQSACATEATSCKGKNSCKGKGWINTTSSDCTQRGGQVSKADS